MKQNIYDDADFFAKYQEYRKSERCLNSVLEQPYLRSALPELSNLRILDIGSGMGNFAKYAIDQRASFVAGVDISKRMCDLAETNLDEGQNVNIFNAAIEDFEWKGLPFDLIVSSLALHYVEDLQTVVTRASSWLAAGSAFVITVNHPLYTATLRPPNDAGSPEPIVYWNEGPRVQDLLNSHVLKYHRTLESYFQTFVNAGLYIDKLVDVSPFHIELDSWEGDEGLTNRPIFMLMSARKPDESSPENGS
jgi:2-polyprenyl-3-methyl-5-hydroxy-6-metoxy-1,4-benzoquinol methylase